MKFPRSVPQLVRTTVRNDARSYGNNVPRSVSGSPGILGVVLLISACALTSTPASSAPQVLAELEANWTGWLDFNDNGVEDIATYEPTENGVRIRVFDFSVSTQEPLWTHEVTNKELCDDCDIGGAGILDFDDWDGTELVYSWTRTNSFQTGFTVFSIPDGERQWDWEIDATEFFEGEPSFTFAALNLADIGDWDEPAGPELVINWFAAQHSGVALLNLANEEITYKRTGLRFATRNNDMSGDGVDDALLFDFVAGEPDSVVFWGEHGATPVLLSEVSVSRNAAGVLLEWTVPQAASHQWFTIEKQIDDGEPSTVATIGPGPSYSYLDQAAVGVESESLYWLVAIDQGGLRLGPFSAEGASGLTDGYRVGAPAPNPFTDETRWRVDIPSSGPVQVEIVDAGGRVVDKQVYPSLSAGTHYLSWSAPAAEGRRSSGVYWIRAKWQDEERARKITRLRR